LYFRRSEAEIEPWVAEDVLGRESLFLVDPENAPEEVARCLGEVLRERELAGLDLEEEPPFGDPCEVRRQRYL
jgi:hypothetical protein